MELNLSGLNNSLLLSWRLLPNQYLIANKVKEIYLKVIQRICPTKDYLKNKFKKDVCFRKVWFVLFVQTRQLLFIYIGIALG